MSTGTPNRGSDTVINIPGYEVIGKIGAGGMGAVYKARQLTLNRFVAIKMIDPRLMDRPDYSELVERLKREAHAAASLADDTIVRVFEFIEGDRPAIVMEYVDGSNLKDLLDRHGRPSVDIALLIFGDMCRALERAHARGIIHRDIKPANVLITPEGKDSHAKVMDFGLARIQQEGSELTLSGTVMGTPHYMSPEQAKGLRDLTAQTDIFSLGVVAYQLFSGARPFDGDSYHDITSAIINEEPHPLSELVGGDLPDEIPQIVQAMLRKDVASRTPNVGLVRTVVDGLISRDALEKRRELLDRWATGGDVAAIPAWPDPPPPKQPEGRDGPTKIAPPSTVKLKPPGGSQPGKEEPGTIPGPPPQKRDWRALIPVALLAGGAIGLLATGWWLVSRLDFPKGTPIGPPSVVVMSDPPTSEPVSIDGTPYTWGRAINLAPGRMHEILVGQSGTNGYALNVPDGSGTREYTVHLNRGFVTLGSETRPAPLRYRLTSRSADVTITSMNPAPVEPGFVRLNVGETLEIEAISVSGARKTFRYAANDRETDVILVLDFERGTLDPVTVEPVDL